MLQTYQGKRAEARKTLQYVLLPPRTPTPRGTILRAGRAARALGRFEDANAFFREAVALAPDDVEINTAWGELFLEKYNRADAVRSFEPALKRDAGLRARPCSGWRARWSTTTRRRRWLSRSAR